ncbi:hypothetical protein H0H81_002833 [Sphagnurus paluster]|uniref:Uncharacterized protein n=1 Tax=Sphagnurus paluster TaxID=117069 RepID=A0A9P7FNY6_9AGAR|nr:hypothetical protein H0H81_002833 [Sphagnurus paluster]
MSASQSGPPSSRQSAVQLLRFKKQKAADTAATKKSLSAAKRQAKINSTAAIEDWIHKEDIEEKKNAVHPNQSTGKKGRPIPRTKYTKAAEQPQAQSISHNVGPAGQGLASNAAVVGAPQPEPMTESHGDAIEELYDAVDLSGMEIDEDLSESVDSSGPPESAVDTKSSDGMLLDDKYYDDKDEDDENDAMLIQPVQKPKQRKKPDEVQDTKTLALHRCTDTASGLRNEVKRWVQMPSAPPKSYETEKLAATAASRRRRETK